MVQYEILAEISVVPAPTNAIGYKFYGSPAGVRRGLAGPGLGRGCIGGFGVGVDAGCTGPHHH